MVTIEAPNPIDFFIENPVSFEFSSDDESVDFSGDGDFDCYNVRVVDVGGDSTLLSTTEGWQLYSGSGNIVAELSVPYTLIKRIILEFDGSSTDDCADASSAYTEHIFQNDDSATSLYHSTILDGGFAFPDVVQVQSDASVIAYGFSFFLVAMFFITWFFRSNKKS